MTALALKHALLTDSDLFLFDQIYSFAYFSVSIIQLRAAKPVLELELCVPFGIGRDHNNASS